MFEGLIKAMGKLFGTEPEIEEKEPGMAEKEPERKEGHRRGAYGAVAIAQALKGADFPMSKADIMEKYGDKEVEYRIGGEQRLRDLLNNLPDQNFNTITELEHTFHESMNKSLEAPRSGIYGAASIAQALKGADFPMSKADIMEKYGDKDVEYHIGKKERLHDILNNLPDQTFDTVRELEHTFHESIKKHKR